MHDSIGSIYAVLGKSQVVNVANKQADGHPITLRPKSISMIIIEYCDSCACWYRWQKELNADHCIDAYQNRMHQKQGAGCKFFQRFKISYKLNNLLYVVK